MFRLNVILVAILVACSLSLVTASHRARQLFVELENEQAAAKRIDEDWRRLQLEQGTLAKHAFVEDIAKKQLGMRKADDGRRLQFVTREPGIANVPSEGAKP